MKKYIFLFASLINAAVTAVYLAITPKILIPIHFDINGIADSYGDKWIHMFEPAIITFFAIAYLIFCLISEHRKGKIKNEKYIFRAIAGILIFLCAVSWTIIIITINGAVQFEQTIPSFMLIFLGLLITFISNMLPKIKQNSFIGIRTFATLNSENVWKKTHRLGAYTGVIGGILIIIFGIFGFAVIGKNSNMSLFFVAIAIVLITLVIIPAIYANRLYKAEKSLD